MKKAILVFTIMLLLGALVVFGVMFTGCAPAEGAEETQYEYIPMHFAKISETKIDRHSYDVIMHTETGVLYIYNDDVYYTCLTVILNADGTPMTYDQFKK